MENCLESNFLKACTSALSLRVHTFCHHDKTCEFYKNSGHPLLLGTRCVQNTCLSVIYFKEKILEEQAALYIYLSSLSAKLR